MSSLFGRIGTQAHKYSFELTVTSLHMSIPLTTPMCVKWTRGPRTATNQPVAGVGGTYEWPPGKPMQMSEMQGHTRCSREMDELYLKKNRYQEKKSKLTVKQVQGKDLKSVGQVELDLADFCGEGEQTRPLTLKLLKCSDKKAFIICTIKSKWLKQMQPGDTDDTASQMSGASSVDARSESAMPQSGQRPDVADLADLDGMEDAIEEEEGGEDEHSQMTASTPSASLSSAAASSSGFRSQQHHLARKPSDAGSGISAASGGAGSAEQAAQIEALQSKVSALTSEVNSERAAASASSSKAASLAAQLAALTEAHEVLRRDLDEAEADADRATVKLRADLATAQAELERSATERAQATKKLEQQLQSAQAENEQLRTRLSAAEAEARTHLANAASPANSSSPKASQQDVALAAAASQARLSESFERERLAFERQMTELRASLEEAHRATADAEARTAAQEQKMRDAATEASRELAARDAEIAQLDATIKSKDAALAEAAEAARRLDSQLIDARRIEKEHAAELASLQASLVTELSRRERAEAAAEADAAAVQELRTSLKKQEMSAEAEAKAARNALAAEREKWAAEMAELKARMQREQEALLASSTSVPSSDADADATAAPAGSPTSADKDAQIASLQSRVEEYMSRLVAMEEDRVRLEGEVETLESALSKHKEDELLALEERYIESNKFKALIRDKEEAMDEALRSTRDKDREAKEAREARSHAAKELAQARLALETAEAQVDALTAKLVRAAKESEKGRLLSDQSTARIRLFEQQIASMGQELEGLKSQLGDKEAEVERATRRRQEAEEAFDTEREALKRQVEEARATAAPSPTAATAAAADKDGGEDGGASTDPEAQSALSAELALAQSQLSKRTMEVSELESSLRELRARVRALEESEERCASLGRQLREQESHAAKRFEALQREKTELGEELTLLREKRERDRQRAAEREEKEQAQRVQVTQQCAELSTQLAAVRTELETAQARVAELQDVLADKQSKVSEQQDRLNSLSRSAETLGREHSELREQVAALTQRLETQARASSTALGRAETDKAAALADLAQLQAQYESLTARRMVFDRIDASTSAAIRAAAQSSKDKALFAQLDALTQKNEFYEDQLQEADEAMTQAKQAWMASARVLQQQNEEGEKELASIKAQLAEALESKGMDATKAQNLETKLKKAEKDKSKLSELMSRFEVELTQKKVELAAALDQLSTMEYEHERIQAQLAKQTKACEAHVAELNKRG